MMRFPTVRMGRSLALMAVMAGLMVPLEAKAETDLSKFPLIRFVPSDVFVTVAARSNPERKFLDDYWGEVTKAFHDSGIVEDVFDMITDAVPDEDLDQVEEVVERFLELGGAVDWGDLCAKEMVYSGRFKPQMLMRGSPYEGVLLMRMDAKKAKSNYTSLKAILDQVASLAKELGADEGVVSVAESKVGDVTFAHLGVKPAPEAPQIPIIGVGYRGDVVIMSISGPGLANDSVEMMKRSSEAEALVNTKRFKGAFKDLPEAEDSIVFFDVTAFFRGVSGMIEVGTGIAGDDEDAQTFAKLAACVIKDISICDYSATVEWTEGYRVFTDTVSALTPNAKSSPFYPVFVNGQTVGDFDKFVPAEAESFWCSSGIDWSAMYRYVLNFVKTNIPDSEEALAEWADLQEEWEFDIDKDLLELIEGPMMAFAKGNDFVLMFKVRDEDKMRTQVNRMIEHVNGLLGQQQFMMTPVTVAGKKKFMQINHPMMMMMGGGAAPVWGCTEGHLILGSSAKFVKICVETGSGDHPRITTNDRFKVEGLVPKSGSVDSVSFNDESGMAEELQEFVGMMTMGMGMMGMMGAQNLPPEGQAIMNAIPQLLAKLGPVVAKLDFFQSSAACSSFSGDRWVTHTVQNYKSPKKSDSSGSPSAMK
ncbi:MAG: hypothetical protein O7F76_07980 [Planctomycetota bacterium]|nr:hypothetical protein [Planctomycetota bacterium]